MGRSKKSSRKILSEKGRGHEEDKEIKGMDSVSASSHKDGVALKEGNEDCVTVALAQESERQSCHGEVVCKKAEKHDADLEANEDNADLESVVSQDSTNSLLVEVDVAIEDDQRESLGTAQQSNERMPHTEARERDHKPETPPEETHKPKKQKHRNNLLASRKLCFDPPARGIPSLPKSKSLPKKSDKFQKSSAADPEFRKKKKWPLKAGAKQDAAKEKLESKDPTESGDQQAVPSMPLSKSSPKKSDKFQKSSAVEPEFRKKKKRPLQAGVKQDAAREKLESKGPTESVKSLPSIPMSKSVPRKSNKFKKPSAVEPEFRKKKTKPLQAGVKQDAGTDKRESEAPAERGTWVQCCLQSCNKWRYLAHILDPAEISDLWVCSMHPDPDYNSCVKAEQAYDDSDHIETQYTLGSLVWAKMDGFPWWPAVVDTDPDYDFYCEVPDEDTMDPSAYHVVFLDKKVTRSWVKKSRIRQLLQAHLMFGSHYLRGHRYKKEVGEAMRTAELALVMPLQERLNTFGFVACFRNESTRWTEAKINKKRPGHKRVQNSDKPRAAKETVPAVKKAKYCGDSDTGPDSCSVGRSSHSSSPSSSSGTFSIQRKHSKLSMQNRPLASHGRKFEVKGQHHTKDTARGEGKEMDETARHQSTSKLYDSDHDPSMPVTSASAELSADGKQKKQFKSEKAKKRNAERKQLHGTTENKQDMPASVDGKQKKLFKSEKAKKRNAERRRLQETQINEQDTCIPEATRTTITDSNKRKGRDEVKAGPDETPRKTMKLDKKVLTLKKKSDPGNEGHSSKKRVKTKTCLSASELPDSDGTLAKLTPCVKTEPSAGSKQKKLFKSEKSKKRDAERNQLQGTEENKQDMPAFLEATQIGTAVADSDNRKKQDVMKAGSGETSKKKIKADKKLGKAKSSQNLPKGEEHSKNKTKPQKFVAPTKPVSENGSSKSEPFAISSGQLQDRAVHPQDKPLSEVTKNRCSPKDKQFPGVVKDKSPPTGAPLSDISSNRLSLTKPRTVSDSEDDSSPLLNSKSKDQFVPSLATDDDEDDGSDDSQLDIKKQVIRSKVKCSKQLAEGDSESDCLDIEEDLAIPSLQQMMSVESKGFSDQEGVDSDPLELPED